MKARQSIAWALIVGLGWLFLSAGSWAQPASHSGDKPVFKHKQPSTLKTIPFKRMDSQALSNEVIVGGLTPPTNTAPIKKGFVTDDQIQADPLALQRKNDTLPGADHGVDVKFQFRQSVTIGDVQHRTQSVLQLPSNRTYGPNSYTLTPH